MLFLTVWSCYFIIGVTSANYGSPPSIITEDITVEQGQFFSSLCYTPDDDITDIYWSTPDGQRVKEDLGNNVYSSQEYGKLLLTILDLGQADEGEYVCKETNNEGETTVLKITALRVLAKSEPKFEESYVFVEAQEGENVTLTCEALGDQPIRYKWFDQYSSLITDSSNRMVVDRGNRSELYLLMVTNETSGVYTCAAANHLGSDSKLFKLTVRQREVREGYLSARVQNVTHDSVTFELIAKDVSAVKVFEAKYRLTRDNNFTRICWSVGEEYKVTGLLPGASYSFEFRIWASDNWTSPIIVALPPGPPEIIVRQLAGNKLSMEFFRPFYLFLYNSIQYYIIKYRTVQQVGGNTWNYRDCAVTIKLPFCYGSSYEISNLASTVYYSITVQAAGPGGSSEPSEMKIYIP